MSEDTAKESDFDMWKDMMELAKTETSTLKDVRRGTFVF